MSRHSRRIRSHYGTAYAQKVKQHNRGRLRLAQTPMDSLARLPRNRNVAKAWCQNCDVKEKVIFSEKSKKFVWSKFGSPARRKIHDKQALNCFSRWNYNFKSEISHFNQIPYFLTGNASIVNYSIKFTNKSFR